MKKLRIREPHLSTAPVRAYREKIRRLSRRIPVRDKRARRNVQARIRRAKRGLDRQRAIVRIARQERIPRRQAARIVQSYPKPIKRRRLQQGKLFDRISSVKRNGHDQLKAAYYNLREPYPESFRDAISQERHRSGGLTPDAYRLFVASGEKSVTASDAVPMATDFDETLTDGIQRLIDREVYGVGSKGDTEVDIGDSIFVTPDDYQITGVRVQFIYSG